MIPRFRGFLQCFTATVGKTLRKNFRWKECRCIPRRRNEYRRRSI